LIERDVHVPPFAPPAVSRDGQWIAFAYGDESRADQFEVTRVDGSGSVVVRPGVPAVTALSLGDAEGRVVAAFFAGAGSKRGVYTADVSGLLELARTAEDPQSAAKAPASP
jgi:hypothetical protein